MSILLIRHGETALNAARVLQPADTPLSERGIAQAARLAQRLHKSGVAHIISSDLPRALRTAEAIAAATGASIATTPLLQERNFGLLRGRAYDSLTVDPLHSTEAPPGGESMAAFEQRVDEAWRMVIRAHLEMSRLLPPGRPLAVVSHGLVLRLLLARSVRPEDLPGHLGNTSVSILEETVGQDGDTPAAPRYLARLVNCTAHLDFADGDDPAALSGG